MADHIFEQCMDAVVAAVTGLSTTGARVIADKVDPLDADDMPGLAVVQIGASLEPQTLPAPRRMSVALDIDVTAYSKKPTATAARTELNQIVKEVAIAMYADRSLGGAAKYVTQLQVDYEFTGDTDKPTASARMRWQVFTGYLENAPDVPN